MVPLTTTVTPGMPLLSSSEVTLPLRVLDCEKTKLAVSIKSTMKNALAPMMLMYFTFLIALPELSVIINHRSIATSSMNDELFNHDPVIIDDLHYVDTFTVLDRRYYPFLPMPFKLIHQVAADRVDLYHTVMIIRVPGHR